MPTEDEKQSAELVEAKASFSGWDLRNGQRDQHS
jgi:hypothetical protein